MPAPRGARGAQKAENPASVGALPGHGPNNPCEENAVNKQYDTTAPTGAAMPDFRNAFDALEAKVYRVQSFASVLAYLTTEDINKVVIAEHGTEYHISEKTGDMIKFLSDETEKASDDLLDAWLETHNARCDAEIAAHRAGRAS